MRLDFVQIFYCVVANAIEKNAQSVDFYKDLISINSIRYLLHVIIDNEPVHFLKAFHLIKKVIELN